MKIPSSVLIAAILSFSPGMLFAQVPSLINYQGRIAVGGTNYDGTGQFKFALVSSNGAATFWSNDGTSVAGSEPAIGVGLTVTKGLYSVLLGNAALPGMMLIPTPVFTNSDVNLRIWFNDGTNGFQLLSPDQRIAAVGYAMMSANVPDGIITSAKLAANAVTSAKLATGAVTTVNLANGVITTAKLADDSIGSAQLADNIDLGSPGNPGVLTVFRNAIGGPSICLLGSSSEILSFGTNGDIKARLFSRPSSFGELDLYDNLNSNLGVVLAAGNDTGGFLSLNSSVGSPRAYLSGTNSGGFLSLYQSGGATVTLNANVAGRGKIVTDGIEAKQSADVGNSTNSAILSVFRNAVGGPSVCLVGGTSEMLSFGTNGDVKARLFSTSFSYGELHLLDNFNSSTGVVLTAGNDTGGSLSLNDSNGSPRALLSGANSGGSLTVYQGDGDTGIVIRGDDGDGYGSIRLFGTNATNTIILEDHYRGS
jgi:hypothetical protein